jgi:hypothetical protein
METLRWVVKAKAITSSAVAPSARPSPLKAETVTAISTETRATR